MSYSISNGSLKINEKLAPLPGVPVQVEQYSAAGYLTVVDVRSTYNNIFMLNSAGETIWQIETGNTHEKFLNVVDQEAATS